MPGALAALIERPAEASYPAATETRLFPPISSCFYDFCGNDAGVNPLARSLLRLSHRQPTAWQRLTASRLAGSGPLAELLRLHRLAFEAETTARHNRADFYWNEFNGLLPAVWANDAAWRIALDESGHTEPATWPVETLKQSVAREIVRDSHRAFAAALGAASGPVAARADWHAVRELASLQSCAMSAGHERTLAGEPIAARIRTHLAAGDPEAAARLSGALLERFPNDSHYQALAIRAEFALATRDAGDEQARAARIRASIETMTAWRERFEDHSDLYEALAGLYMHHAASLANDGALADALVDLAKASAANPALAHLAETTSQVTELMKSLQAQMAAVGQQLASRPYATLNAEGRRLQQQAARGFGPAIEWNRSPECQAMVAGRVRGETRTLWRDVGLPPSEWNAEQGTALVCALGDILHQRPATELEITRAWRKASLRHCAGELDSAAITAWLNARLNPGPDETAVETPAITLTSVESQPGAPAVSEWLTSRAARRVRYQLAALVMFAALAAGLGARDVYRDRVRSTAFAALQRATAARDAVDAAEQYFAVGRPFREPAAREHFAWRVYSQSIVRLVAESGSTTAPEVARRLERFAATSRWMDRRARSSVN